MTVMEKIKLSIFLLRQKRFVAHTDLYIKIFIDIRSNLAHAIGPNQGLIMSTLIVSLNFSPYL
ncbi:unnamed protein product [Arabidopsis halleri]